MLILRDAVVKEMTEIAARHPQVEVTGFVAEGPTGEQRVQQMRNVSPYPDKYYDWDAVQMMEEYVRLDARNEQPILIYHSHPKGKPDPSETDMLGALHLGMHYGILYPNVTEMYSGPDRWELSTWECIDMGILLHAPHEVTP